MFALSNANLRKAEPDNGDGYPSPHPIEQIEITRLVRWSDPHNIFQQQTDLSYGDDHVANRIPKSTAEGNARTVKINLTTIRQHVRRVYLISRNSSKRLN